MLISEDEQTSFEDYESWDEFRHGIQVELEKTRRDLRDTKKKIEHSLAEVDRLAKRNASITTQLQQVQSQLESMPRAEIRSAYDAALDALQRLFVMRGQLEKLQSDQVSIKKYEEILEKITRLLDKEGSTEPGSANSFTNVEMMIQAQEAERQRLSRQMHDGPAQALSNFILQTEIATRYFDVDPNKAREELQVLKSAATTTFRQVRDFIFQLRPMMLDDLGMVPTVKRYIDAVKEQTGVDIVVSVSGTERRLEPYLEVVVFRSIQELLNNAINHSQASEIKVQLDVPDNEVRVSIDDNGKGFDIQILETQSNLGLKLIKERAEMLGGYFEVDSVIGHGTRVSFQIPIAKPAVYA
jgi:two-component system sensor histidine kinase DegS